MIKLIPILNEIIYDDLEKITTWDDLKKVFQKYKHDLKYLSEYEGEEANNLLGSGGTGKVFRIGNTNKAIKISQHYKDYQACIKLVGKNPKNLIKIYEAKEIENKKSYVALIVMEYCSPLPNDIADFIDDNQYELNSYFSGSNEKNLFKKFKHLEPQFNNIKKELNKFNITEEDEYELDVRSDNFLINSIGNICFVDIIDPFL